MSENNQNRNYENVHWADNSAQRVINTFPNEKVYIVASGVSPSGIVHVGHFREIITTELVRRALEKKGKKTKFIYSWDSYDAFRKVPKNLPKEFDKYLRLSDADVPDPWNCHESFAEHYMQTAESELKVFNLPIEFQRQHLLQTSGIYAEGIKNYLSRYKEIKNIINKHRPEDRPLKDDWFPIEIYCEKCKKDGSKISNYDNKYSFDYECEKCGHKDRINFKKKPIVKLAWRLDWPMRWNHYNVTFEPGGKDHSTPGGSYDTGCEIIKAISKREPPVYTFYNLVGMKGQNGKISSSSGNGATIGDVLKVYTPELILFIFAGTRPNAEFDISFDLDVIKVYEDFDKLERIYFGVDNEKNEKKLATLKRTYELSQIDGREIPKKIPFQPSFRHLVNNVQSNYFDYGRIKKVYENEIKTKFDEERLKERIEVVKNWIEIYAPEDMKFEICKKINVKLSANNKKIIVEIRDKLENINEHKELVNLFKETSNKYNIETKELFKILYLAIVGKEKGPRLSNLILENKKEIINLLNQI